MNRTPVADIVPHAANPDPWVPAATVRRVVAEAAADPQMLAELADIRGAELDAV